MAALILVPDQHATECNINATEDGMVYVVDESAHGCTDTAGISIHVHPLQYGVFIPNAFSPNGDGNNDKFAPRIYMDRAYVIRVFRVFNRFGQLVYSAAHNNNAAWDGTYPDGNKADMGNYHYYTEVQFIDGKVVKLKGDVTLLR